MRSSRRRFVRTATGIGAVVLSGCLGAPGAEEGNGQTGIADGDNGADDEHNTVKGVVVRPVHRDAAGDWWSDEAEETGIVVTLTDEEEVRTLIDEGQDLDEFVEGTDFERDSVYFIESVGPDACYREIDVDDVREVGDDADEELEGTATVIDVSEEDEACATVITFPAVLIRVDAGIGAVQATFHITDGWGNERSKDAVSVDEFTED